MSDINSHMRTHASQDGITLLVTLLLMGVLLGVSTSLLNITLKQYQLSGIALDSEIAFQAANAGMECALYQDFSLEAFDIYEEYTNPVSPRAPLNSLWCMGVEDTDGDSEPDSDGNNQIESGTEQLFAFEWGDTGNKVCTELSVYKFFDESSSVPVIVEGDDLRGGSLCPAGSVCTVVQSRGYNVGCNEIGTSARVTEREYVQVY